MATDVKDIAERVDVLRDRFTGWGLLVGTVSIVAAVWTTAPTLEIELPLPAGAKVSLNLGYILAVGMPLLALAYAWSMAPLLAVRRYQDAVAREVGQGSVAVSAFDRLRLMGPYAERGPKSRWEGAAWSTIFGARVLILFLVPVLGQVWIGEQYFFGLHYFEKAPVVAHQLKELQALPAAAASNPSPQDSLQWVINPRDTARWHEYLFADEPQPRLLGGEKVSGEYYFVENGTLESACVRLWMREHFEAQAPSSDPLAAMAAMLKAQGDKPRCVFTSFPRFTLWVNSWINLISFLVVGYLAATGLGVFSGAYFSRRLAQETAKAALANRRIIVLIRWRIKPTDEAVSAFFEWWKTVAVIKDKTNLVGEFLSAPLPAKDFPLLVDDLSPRQSESPHRAFIDVGIWKDWESFYKEVGHNFRDDRPPLDFEAEKRTRTILEPREWRRGAWQLPTDGTCP